MNQIAEIFKAAENGDLNYLTRYLGDGGDVNAQDPIFSLSLFQIAIAHHNVAFAKQVAAVENFDPFLTDRHGRTALDIAQSTGNSGMINLVMDHLKL